MTSSQLEIQRGLPAARMVQYFKKADEGFWDLIPEIKNLVQFKKQNLLEPFHGMGTFNLILCRYVLIYQDSDRKKAILEKLEKCVVPKGHLILGASESAFGVLKDVNQLSLDGAIVYQKK